VMTLIGGDAFRAAGDVLRIQVGALMFIALYQLWTVSLVALGRQRDLILTNALGLLGVGLFAAVLVPLFAATGGATASVAGDGLLACLIYARVRKGAGPVMVGAHFLLRVAAAAALGAGVLLVPGLPDPVAAAAAALVFLGAGYLLGMLPPELFDAFGMHRLEHAARRGVPGRDSRRGR
jgi:O-antigen/teichoic acid export membrane protein